MESHGSENEQPSGTLTDCRAGALLSLISAMKPAKYYLPHRRIQSQASRSAVMSLPN
jgi:hypothetical protein